MKKQIITSYLIAASALVAGAAPLSFEGQTAKVLEADGGSSSGLQKVYILRSTDGVKAAYPSVQAKWSIYGHSGAAYAEPVASQTIGGNSLIDLPQGDCGILVEDGGRQYCFWIVDYSRHLFHVDAIEPLEQQEDCNRTTLAVSGSNTEAIPYYSILGARLELGRELIVEYTTLEADEESFTYVSKTVSDGRAGVGTLFGVEAPLCQTAFSLSGDRFLRQWGEEETVVSATFLHPAVAAETRATQTQRDIDNEQKDGDESGLGGSAPCEISFEAIVSDGVVFREWQMSKSADFDIVENSYNEDSFTYTFTEQGTTYVRFTADNAEGTCPFEGQVYEVSIGESKLEIPNAFSPATSPGVNDEWKVSYRSLVEFECHIFNKWGTKMTSFTDPSQGWDGKYGGKFVPAGTYYYVIKARGADGKEYKKSGDINIINYSTTRTGSGETAE